VNDGLVDELHRAATIPDKLRAMRAWAVIASLAACGDNAKRPDAFTGAPELALVTSQMDGTVMITNTDFTPDACELVEGCIGAAGTRRLLQFSTVTANLGTADLDLGPVPPPGVSDGIFVWSPCHMHHHVMGYADYELRDGTGVIAAGHKQGFCIEDDEQVVPLGPSRGYNCTMMGISIGWADAYDRTKPCQWVDITDVVSGTYELRVTIDATGVLADSDPSDNSWSTTVSF
jgi:hypothetical protein